MLREETQSHVRAMYRNLGTRSLKFASPCAFFGPGPAIHEQRGLLVDAFQTSDVLKLLLTASPHLHIPHVAVLAAGLCQNHLQVLRLAAHLQLFSRFAGFGAARGGPKVPHTSSFRASNSVSTAEKGCWLPFQCMVRVQGLSGHLILGFKGRFRDFHQCFCSSSLVES